MTVHVINLDRDTDRMRTFLAKNAHVPDIIRISAVDGRAIDRTSLTGLGITTADLAYTNGVLGCAMSHVRLWRKCLKDGRPITIAEDDALLAANFQPAHELMLNRLPADWDVVLWGWNFDHMLCTEIPEGASPAVMQFDQNALRRNIEVFRATHASPSTFRLHFAYGTLAYSLSLSGAQALLGFCLPLTNARIEFRDIFDLKIAGIANTGIDCIMNASYSKMKSYVCIPPLAVSENYSGMSRDINDSP